MWWGGFFFFCLVWGVFVFFGGWWGGYRGLAVVVPWRCAAPSPRTWSYAWVCGLHGARSGRGRGAVWGAGQGVLWCLHGGRGAVCGCLPGSMPMHSPCARRNAEHVTNALEQFFFEEISDAAHTRQSVRPVGWLVASTAAAGRSSRGSGGSAPGAPQRFTRSAPHETQKAHDFHHILHAQKPRAAACRMWEHGAARCGGLPRASGWLQPCAGGCLVHTSGGFHHATT